MPQLGLRTRGDAVRFGQFLKIVCAAQQWIVIKLLVPDLHHVQDNLRILWVVLITTVVQCFPGARQCDRRHQASRQNQQRRAGKLRRDGNCPSRQKLRGQDGHTPRVW
jgi:hypothetical protein